MEILPATPNLASADETRFVSSKPPTSRESAMDQIPLADESFDPGTISVVKAVIDAVVPGVLFSEADLQNPEIAPLIANGRALFTKSGLSVYPSKNGTALYNPNVINAEEVKKLDAKGKLGVLFPPASQFFGTATPGVVGEVAASAGAGVSAGMPLSPSAESRISGVRAQSAALAGKPPSKKSSPAAGTLFNKLLQPTV